MFRIMMLAAPLLLVPVAAPVPLIDAAAVAQAVGGEDCRQQRDTRRRRGRGLGSLVGGIAGRVGGVASVVSNLLPVGELLGEAIASMLDCDEQQKAAVATQEVVEQAERGGVGTSVDWESETRPGVRGSSTVTAVETASSDGECMTVTDIVIVDGEETRAPKRMCRRPPNTRYVRV
jgi:surface antigen